MCSIFGIQSKRITAKTHLSSVFFGPIQPLMKQFQPYFFCFEKTRKIQNLS